MYIKSKQEYQEAVKKLRKVPSDIEYLPKEDQCEIHELCDAVFKYEKRNNLTPTKED